MAAEVCSSGTSSLSTQAVVEDNITLGSVVSQNGRFGVVQSVENNNELFHVWFFHTTESQRSCTTAPAREFKLEKSVFGNPCQTATWSDECGTCNFESFVADKDLIVRGNYFSVQSPTEEALYVSRVLDYDEKNKRVRVGFNDGSYTWIVPSPLVMRIPEEKDLLEADIDMEIFDNSRLSDNCQKIGNVFEEKQEFWDDERFCDAVSKPSKLDRMKPTIGARGFDVVQNVQRMRESMHYISVPNDSWEAILTYESNEGTENIAHRLESFGKEMRALKWFNPDLITQLDLPAYMPRAKRQCTVKLWTATVAKRRTNSVQQFANKKCNKVGAWVEADLKTFDWFKQFSDSHTSLNIPFGYTVDWHRIMKLTQWINVQPAQTPTLGIPYYKYGNSNIQDVCAFSYAGVTDYRYQTAFKHKFCFVTDCVNTEFSGAKFAAADMACEVPLTPETIDLYIKKLTTAVSCYSWRVAAMLEQLGVDQYVHYTDNSFFPLIASPPIFFQVSNDKINPNKPESQKATKDHLDFVIEDRKAGRAVLQSKVATVANTQRKNNRLNELRNQFPIVFNVVCNQQWYINGHNQVRSDFNPQQLTSFQRGVKAMKLYLERIQRDMGLRRKLGRLLVIQEKQRLVTSLQSVFTLQLVLPTSKKNTIAPVFNALGGM